MSEEDNLIEELKRSLKIKENEYLESEIDDLKEFFTVQTRESSVGQKETDYPIVTSDKKCFWLEVFLPVTLRKITKEGKEVLINEKPSVSFKIKLKNGKITADELEFEDKVVIQNTNGTTEATTEATDSEDINYATDDTEKVANVLEPNDTTENTEITNTDDVNKIVTNSELVTVTETTNIIIEDCLPYEIVEVEVTELIEESDTNSLIDILKSLIHPSDLSLLSVIEEFYIKLEEENYPNKAVICRDYYYPVFDSRHWGRSSQSQAKSQNNSDPNSSISYRARALYDFQALMQGELSFQENEILIVLANLGNGWLTARRTSTSTTSINETGEDTITGLIPENYIERL